jgi:hypothetical protein
MICICIKSINVKKENKDESAIFFNTDPLEIQVDIDCLFDYKIKNGYHIVYLPKGLSIGKEGIKYIDDETLVIKIKSDSFKKYFKDITKEQKEKLVGKEQNVNFFKKINKRK